jgi:hypothetical protein
MNLLSDQQGTHSGRSLEMQNGRRHSSVTSVTSGRESLGASWVKRLSTAFSGDESNEEKAHSRRFSVDDIRESISSACPVVLPEKNRDLFIKPHETCPKERTCIEYSASGDAYHLLKTEDAGVMFEVALSPPYGITLLQVL